jgi:hypothetical protein
MNFWVRVIHLDFVIPVYVEVIVNFTESFYIHVRLNQSVIEGAWIALGCRKVCGTHICFCCGIAVMDPAQQIGLTMRSNIEGKIDHGYLVSVTVGTEKLRGVIYHVPPMQRAPQHATISSYEATIGADPIMSREEPSLRGIKRKRRRADDMPRKDPNAPRPNRTGYNFFFAEQRARLKALHPEKDKELSRMIGDAWNSLTEEEKAVSRTQTFSISMCGNRKLEN